MKKYVVGFLFNSEDGSVVLIRKNKPAWQMGRLNGVGGKVEKGEQPFQAMVREFNEEAGIRIDHWREFCILTGDGYQIHFFEANSKRATEVRTMEDEEIVTENIATIHNISLISNLYWLIPLALDRKTTITMASHPSETD